MWCFLKGFGRKVSTGSVYALEYGWLPASTVYQSFRLFVKLIYSHLYVGKRQLVHVTPTEFHKKRSWTVECHPVTAWYEFSNNAEFSHCSKSATVDSRALAGCRCERFSGLSGFSMKKFTTYSNNIQFDKCGLLMFCKPLNIFPFIWEFLSRVNTAVCVRNPWRTCWRILGAERCPALTASSLTIRFQLQHSSARGDFY